ncbi:unnamed protein product [Dibothriocephalus latus]|uniref:Uncharacterized protein n=1 Tax=Dibothriocephalus latus TaxID=60516 RepID=A0A3P7R664_DIBLA|nr:unnamed protein product [Dibothriocephalus latus]
MVLINSALFADDTLEELDCEHVSWKVIYGVTEEADCHEYIRQSERCSRTGLLSLNGIKGTISLFRTQNQVIDIRAYLPHRKAETRKALGVWPICTVNYSVLL